jgi:hypothetical protein
MTAPDQFAETLIKTLACGSHPHTTLRVSEQLRRAPDYGIPASARGVLSDVAGWSLFDRHGGVKPRRFTSVGIFYRSILTGPHDPMDLDFLSHCGQCGLDSSE